MAVLRHSVMAATSALSSADIQSTSSVEHDNEQTLDVQVLKDAAKRALVNALNSASSSISRNLARPHRSILGKRRKDARARLSPCRAPGTCYGGRALEGVFRSERTSC